MLLTLGRQVGRQLAVVQLWTFCDFGKVVDLMPVDLWLHRSWSLQCIWLHLMFQMLLVQAVCQTQKHLAVRNEFNRTFERRILCNQ
jgi:hypothetical protein